MSIAQDLINLGFAPFTDFLCQDDSDGNGPYIAQWFSEQSCPFPELRREIVAGADAPIARWTTVEGALEYRFAELKALRWQHTLRFTFEGVETDANSAIAVVTASIVSMSLPGGDEVKLWKLADGVYREWTLTQLIAFGRAIEAHIQSCFVREAVLAVDLMTAAQVSIEAVEAVDIDQGWP